MIRNVLLYIWGCVWGCIQTVLGLVVYLAACLFNRSWGYSPEWGVFIFRRFFGSGVCLGEWIILEGDPSRVDQESVRHECGHRVQSRILGPLYLLVVGVPSLARNVYGRLVLSKTMTVIERQLWYYSGFPERWADRLGGVTRSYLAKKVFL